MTLKDKRLAELYKWASSRQSRQNLPTIIEHAIKRYKVTEHTARGYAIAIMVKLGKLSQPMKVSDIWKDWRGVKARLEATFAKASELKEE